MRFLLFLIALLGFILRSNSQDAFKFDDLPFLGAAVPAASPAVTLVGWFRGDTVVTNNANGVTNWPDKSGVNTFMANTTSAEAPTYTVDASINGEPYLLFDGGDRLRGSTVSAYSQPCTMFLLCKVIYAGGTITAVSGTNSSYSQSYSADQFNRPIILAGTTITGSGTVASNKWYLIEATFNGTSSSIITNGVSNATGDSGTQPISGFCVGANRFYTASWNGAIAEWRVYNGDVSSGDRTSIRTYFTNRYGLYSTW